MNYPKIEVVDMHTGGEPLRIITGGYPHVEGKTILDKRRYVRDHLDHLRTFLMFEPRGHKEMYGALLVEPNLPGADLAVLFMHNEGYSTMCGHAVIALARYAVDEGLVSRQEPVTRVGIECPCGLVNVDLDVASGNASFVSVPAFAANRSQKIRLENGRQIVVDVAYGGAFYALVEDKLLGVDVHHDSVQKLTQVASQVTENVKTQVDIVHPESTDLGFLYGTIITDGRLGSGMPSRNICVFADEQVDRSPTGSGVTARMALAHAVGSVGIDETVTFESIVGSKFEAKVVDTTSIGSMPAVQVEVSGKAFYTGRTVFEFEEGDDLGKGFLCR